MPVSDDHAVHPLQRVSSCPGEAPTPATGCKDKQARAHLVVINAQKIRVTGRKLSDKIYYHHTGFIGGIKSIALEKLLAEHPERAIEIAVKGMLPKNPLGRAMFRKLHVFAGTEHPHQAQQPKPLEIQ